MTEDAPQHSEQSVETPQPSQFWVTFSQEAVARHRERQSQRQRAGGLDIPYWTNPKPAIAAAEFQRDYRDQEGYVGLPDDSGAIMVPLEPTDGTGWTIVFGRNITPRTSEEVTAWTEEGIPQGIRVVTLGDQTISYEPIPPKGYEEAPPIDELGVVEMGIAEVGNRARTGPRPLAINVEGRRFDGMHCVDPVALNPVFKEFAQTNPLPGAVLPRDIAQSVFYDAWRGQGAYRNRPSVV